MHDCGTVLHPGMVEGQIRGGFAQGLGAALYEELTYDDEGSFLAGSFADYLLPTATEVPALEILHIETPSPFTPLGAKGVGERNCIPSPVCIATAVSDGLGVEALDLPLTPAKLMALIAIAEPAAPEGLEPLRPVAAGGRTLHGDGTVTIAAAPEKVWAMLLDPAVLGAVIPGCHAIERVSESAFRAEVSIGVGPVRGRYRAEIALSELDPPRGATLAGTIAGALGTGEGRGRVLLAADEAGGTRLTYSYEARAGGKVAAIGARMLDGAGRVIIAQFFRALAARAAPPGHTAVAGEAGGKPWSRLLDRFRGKP